jgi:hypothetical protein
MAPERLDLFERDLAAHAKTISEFTLMLRDLNDRTGKLEQAQAVQAVEDRLQRQMLDEKMTGITLRIDAIYRLGWWLFSAVATSSIAVIVMFVFKGGFIVK